MPNLRNPRSSKCSCGGSSQRGSSASVDKSAGRKYNCPVCFEFLLPPVYQCFNGHLICDACLLKLKSCPVCRDSFAGKKIRNLAVEDIVRECSYECKNIEAGCTLQLKYDQVRDHDLDCKYSSLNFCDALGLSCDQKLGESAIIEHLKTVHRVKGVESPSDSEMVVDIEQVLAKGDMERWNTLKGPPHYFIFNDKIFFLKTLVEVKEKCVSWMLCVAGSQKSAEKYDAKIRHFQATTGSKQSIDWNGPVYSFERKFENAYVLTVPIKSLAMTASAQPTFGRARRPQDYKIHLQISIKQPAESHSRPAPPVGGNLYLNSVISGGGTSPTQVTLPDNRSLFDGLRAIINTSSSTSDSSSESDDNNNSSGNSNSHRSFLEVLPNGPPLFSRRGRNIFISSAQQSLNNNNRDRPSPYRVPSNNSSNRPPDRVDGR